MQTHVAAGNSPTTLVGRESPGSGWFCRGGVCLDRLHELISQGRNLKERVCVMCGGFGQIDCGNPWDECLRISVIL